MKQSAVEVKIGQIWRRRNGSTLTIERIDRGYADYWLNTGSKPQFRSIRLENLTRLYTLVDAKGGGFGKGDSE